MDSASLLDQALGGESRQAKRNAFIELLASDNWKLVLAPHVLSHQGYELSDGFYPDLVTLKRAAEVIAGHEERIQHTLEILGCRFSLDLCEALARHMGTALVEHVLAHLRTAADERAVLLQRILHTADPRWVALPEARRVLRQRLRCTEPGRTILLDWISQSGNLEQFMEELREFPPARVEEWNALGRAGISDPGLVNLALRSLGAAPDSLCYLLRLDPVPDGVALRIMAAARPDWLVQTMEIAIVLGLHHHHLVALAELGIRLGGRPMAAATAWLGAARLGKEILACLAEHITRENGKARVNDLLWVQRRTPSANRALEDGRKGAEPDPLDAAALVRQLRGDKVPELVREILSRPRPLMIESVLRPLCAVNPEAATEVMLLCDSADPEVSRRAREARAWPDVAWPPEPPAAPQ